MRSQKCHAFNDLGKSETFGVLNQILWDTGTELFKTLKLGPCQENWDDWYL